MGEIYEDGNGVPCSLDRAINCYRLAAKSGDAQAMMRLSELFMPGSKAPADLVESVKWLQLAARNQYGNASQLLNALTKAGRVTMEQYEEASRRADDFQRAFGTTPAER